MVSCVPKEMFSFPWPWVWVPLISIIVIYHFTQIQTKPLPFFFFLISFLFFLDLEKWMPIMQYYGSCMSVAAKKEKKKLMMKSISRWHTHWLLDLYHHVCNGVSSNACFWGSVWHSCIMHASFLYTIRDQQNQSDRKYIQSFDFEDRLQKDWNGHLLSKSEGTFLMWLFIYASWEIEASIIILFIHTVGHVILLSKKQEIHPILYDNQQVALPFAWNPGYFLCWHPGH